ncbi:hypothetical protein COLO4_05371 [Corchorus olitorius]|uniref:Uncharacterized protein n=1 Tax=Corchorus olitorius TaxID=93759 RepID=A0A1R3KR10_9ROSI|nr:hypothetical protein COLO4_05371 [Corchorus olitorius]
MAARRNIAANKATKTVASGWYNAEYNRPVSEMHQA